MHSFSAMNLVLVTAMLSIMSSAHAASRSLKLSVWGPPEAPCWGDCPAGSTAVSGSQNLCRTMVCPSWLVKLGDRCYWACAEGFTADGTRCRQTCPKGYIDRGTTCQQRFVITAKTGSRCPAGSEDRGTECWQRFVPFTRPRAEQYRMHFDVFPTCEDDTERDSDGLCYPVCDPGFQGQGPLCVPEGEDQDAPDTYERGPGSEPVIPSMDWCTKANGYELIGQTCYMECDSGFAPVQTPPGVPPLCMEICPEGFTAVGNTCVQQTRSIAKSTLRTYTRPTGAMRQLTSERPMITCDLN